ncbi:DUF3828 domain-containing protein [Rhizobium oryzicola]|uniref:DUF3828 domain-containing protein n=1 Tax=Rhizobium oryzicola TaxID=1232668 RepID=A0ABT8T303_9HYPH|nr:DUF3828 domain-containing protein [Rhizobium oryzicola]MDO1584673.1 DUF3828 domain-containing protein [Rhizobium oryzicola]
MRLPALVLSFLIVAATALTAQAETFKTPQALMKALYAFNPDTAPQDRPTPYTPFFSRALIALFQADRDRTPEGEIGAIDFDPVINGQDGRARNLTLTEPVIKGNTAKLQASFTNGKRMVLHYTLVQEQGGWKVDDIADPKAEYPWSLRELLK